MLAYESAALLREAGEEVSLLAVIDAMPLPSGYPEPDEIEAEVLRLMPFDLEPGTPLPPLPHTRAMLFPLLREHGRLFAGFSDARLTAMADTAVNHVVLAHGWQQPSPYDGPVTLFSATQVPSYLTTPFKIVAWGRTGVRLDIHELDCAHSGVLDPEPARRIGEVLETVLRDRRTGSAPASAPTPKGE
ncbi:hypothetical protein GXW82_04425 [Streptacidiphilus sp. 4-A2]|nr:hypothetical protein [Streptacidiphilus sp. 4-A2]